MLLEHSRNVQCTHNISKFVCSHHDEINAYMQSSVFFIINLWHIIVHNNLSFRLVALQIIKNETNFLYFALVKVRLGWMFAT